MLTLPLSTLTLLLDSTAVPSGDLHILPVTAATECIYIRQAAYLPSDGSNPEAAQLLLDHFQTPSKFIKKKSVKVTAKHRNFVIVLYMLHMSKKK